MVNQLKFLDVIVENLIANYKQEPFTVTQDGKLYLERYYIFPRVFVHRIYESDDLRELHNHPFSFRSLILDGSYRELSMDTFGSGEMVEKTFKRGDVNEKLKPWEYHALEIIEPVTTLIHIGFPVLKWGFQTKQGHINHDNYPMLGVEDGWKPEFSDGHPDELVNMSDLTTEKKRRRTLNASIKGFQIITVEGFADDRL